MRGGCLVYTRRTTHLMQDDARRCKPAFNRVSLCVRAGTHTHVSSSLSPLLLSFPPSSPFPDRYHSPQNHPIHLSTLSSQPPSFTPFPPSSPSRSRHLAAARIARRKTLIKQLSQDSDTALIKQLSSLLTPAQLQRDGGASGAGEEEEDV